jgi:hypothetical protein
MKMNDYSHEEMISFLLKEFPEFEESSRYKDLAYLKEDRLSLVYVVWGEFASYSVERLKENGSEDKIVQKLFTFINECFENEESSSWVLDLLTVEIFEEFVQTENGLSYARAHTNGKARHRLEIVLTATGVGKPDLTIAPDAEAIMQRLRNQIKGYSK